MRLPPQAAPAGDSMVGWSTATNVQARVEAAGHPGWARDRRFGAYADRRVNGGEFMDLAEAWSGVLTMAQCRALFDPHGVPCSPYRTVAEALADPQVANRGAMAEVRDAGDSFKVLTPPFRLSAADTRAGAHSPALGEHTAQVLREAGLDEASLAALKAGS